MSHKIVSHGAKLLRILRDQGTEFVNKEFSGEEANLPENKKPPKIKSSSEQSFFEQFPLAS